MKNIKIDLHTHSRFSECSLLNIESLINAAKNKGLDGIALTDHNTMEGVKKAKEIADNFLIIPGMEIRCDRGDILGLFLEEEIKNRKAPDVIEEIKSQGGLVIIPHPFDRLRLSNFGDPGSLLERVDGIEVFNSRVLLDGNKRAMDFVKGKGLIRTAGSDGHTAREIGNGWTEGEASTLPEFRRILEKGEVSLAGRKSGPFVHLNSYFSIIRKKFNY